MNWITYIICFALLSFLVKELSKQSPLSSKVYLISFFIKIGYGLVYLFIFKFYFSDGSIYGDTYRFLLDSYNIQQIIFESPSTFFKLFFGLGELNTSEINNHLNNTQIWDYGNNGDWINDNRLIIRVNIVLQFISQNNPYIHALCFSFLSFLGIHLIYLAFSQFIERKKLFWGLLILWPSIGFWGGGILKETILVLGIGLWFYSLFKLLQKFNFIHFIYLISSIILLLFNKPYAGLFIVSISVIIVYGHFLKWKTIGLFISSVIFLIVFLFSIFSESNLSLTNRLTIKQRDLNNLGKGGVSFITDSSFCVFPYHTLQNFKFINRDEIKVVSKSFGEYKLFGEKNFIEFEIKPSQLTYPVYLIYPPSTSHFDTELINYSPSKLIKRTPNHFINVLLRPFPWDNGDKLKTISFSFNLILILLFVVAILKRKKIDEKSLFILFALLFMVLIITFIIGASIPIFGAIVRYKLPVEILLIISSLILLKSSKHENSNI